MPRLKYAVSALRMSKEAKSVEAVVQKIVCH